MKKKLGTLPTVSVISSITLEKKRLLRELTRPRDCLVVDFSDDLLPYQELEPNVSTLSEAKLQRQELDTSSD